MRRFGKFGLVGLAGAVLQVVLFDLLIRYLHLPGVAAMPLAVEAAVLHNFMWHERFTWGDRRFTPLQQQIFDSSPADQAGLLRRRRNAALPRALRQSAIRLWRFHAANGLISLGGNTALAWFLVEQLNAPALPAAVVAIALCAPLNFIVADRWVYVSQGEEKAVTPKNNFFLAHSKATCAR